MAKKIENLFGPSRFVLPEQRELYLQMKEDDKLVPMPILGQDELESFHYQFRNAGRENYAVANTWWKHKENSIGTTCRMWRKVEWVDTNSRKVKLLTDEDVQWIPMDTISDVRS
ncbi:YolD-like protein [Brevibacillus sp. AG162]|uniref:YolD-like family protein n=1 Tax=Brevibacillus sp. AG162 TaxID=2572910 RepID=UPI0011544F67|nr:YolD-like family protein [Brevibacillus sp. AG162]TQK73509.1 YolD-like protein [Brevibacillus sp. AG162]